MTHKRLGDRSRPCLFPIIAGMNIYLLVILVFVGYWIIGSQVLTHTHVMLFWTGWHQHPSNFMKCSFSWPKTDANRLDRFVYFPSKRKFVRFDSPVSTCLNWSSKSSSLFNFIENSLCAMFPPIFDVFCPKSEPGSRLRSPGTRQPKSRWVRQCCCDFWGKMWYRYGRDIEPPVRILKVGTNKYW